MPRSHFHPDASALVSSLGAILLSACASMSGSGTPPKLAVLDHVDDIAAENGDRILVVRDYMDEVKLDGRNVQRRYQYAWNYTRSVGQERIYDLDGNRISLTDMPELSLGATRQEQEYAFSVVRADKRWARYLPPNSSFYGGFIFKESTHPQCAERSRCIHVFASSDAGQHTTLHVIVNLVSGTSFDPGLGAGQDHKPLSSLQQESQQ